MSTCRYSSMRICMCQHCSTQTHSSAEGDRQGVAFTPFQYKQHIKKRKSTISPKSLPNIPTSASGSECPQILLDQIFPADYSQLIQRTFSTPASLNATAQKPYSGSQTLPPQDLGMIISAILSLRYNIPRRATCILKPSLNLFIKSSISSSGGPPLLHSIYLKISVQYLNISKCNQLLTTIYVVLNIFFLMALLNLSQQTNPTVNAIITQMIMIPLAHNH
ncbi:hypothetical protein O181_060288 [Austropuccinia psidii MF-1]|uniref:Uncharacterized protein n=1 Tax=Austropuccinia psidii MF-1 TaxID=1389203 RepID=A0A9Q3EKH7_9BASI|nr:hypothetical protein [Austropuccinia psidii MF-1]